MGGTACDDFEDAGILKFPEGSHQVPMVPVAEHRPTVVKSIMIKPGQIVKDGIVLGAVELLASQFN
jgi:hypothetical protein